MNKWCFIYKKVVLSVFLLIAGGMTYAQVLVGTEETTIETSAILQMESTSLGLKIPTYDDLIAIQASIADPAKGLMVYNTSEDCLMVNIGDASTPNWTCLERDNRITFSADCSTLTGIYAFIGGSYDKTFTIDYSGNIEPADIEVANLPPGLSAQFLSSGSGVLTFRVFGTPTNATDVSGIADILILDSNGVVLYTCSMDYVSVSTRVDCSAGKGIVIPTPSFPVNQPVGDGIIIFYEGVQPVASDVQILGMPPGMNYNVLYIYNPSKTIDFDITGTPNMAGTYTLTFVIKGYESDCTGTITITP